MVLIYKGERQHTGVDMYRNVDSRVTRKWLAYLVPADLSDLLCHTGRHGISSSLELMHQTPDNIYLLLYPVHFACVLDVLLVWISLLLLLVGTGSLSV